MNGGYYAIKGFEYPIDKSIHEVLSCNDLNQEVAIEQIQDLNTDSFVMQIKYKKASKLIPSVIVGFSFLGQLKFLKYLL